MTIKVVRRTVPVTIEGTGKAAVALSVPMDSSERAAATVPCSLALFTLSCNSCNIATDVLRDLDIDIYLHS